MLYVVCGSYSMFASWRNKGLIAFSPHSGAGATLTSGNIFNCHVSLASFSSEYIHSLSLFFYDINNLKQCIFFPLPPFLFTDEIQVMYSWPEHHTGDTVCLVRFPGCHVGCAWSAPAPRCCSLWSAGQGSACVVPITLMQSIMSALACLFSFA